MKKQNLFKTVALLCALIVGSLNSWAQSDYSDIYTSGITLSTTGGTSASTTKIKISGTETQYDAIKCGTGKAAGAMKLTVPSGAKYLHIHVAGWNGESVTLSVTPSTNVSPNSISLTSDTGVSGSSSPFVLSGTVSNYYKVITFAMALTSDTELTLSATSGNRFVIWGVNAEEEAAATGEATSVTIDDSGITNTDVYTSTAAGSLTATVKDESDEAIDGATVTWSSSNTDIATIDATGVVTLVKKGTTTITASYAGVTDTYQPSSTTYELKVTNSNTNDGSLAKPFTVEEAIEFIEAKSYESQNYYVIGKVSQIGTLSNGMLTYYISDDGSTTNQLQVYKGKGLGNVSFTATTDITLGDDVIVVGPLLYYNNTTAEINTGNYIYSLNGTVAPILTISDNANGTILVENGDNEVETGSPVVEGTTLTLTATPATGYSFSSWTASAGTLANSTSASTTFTMPNEAATLSATFTANTHVLGITSANGDVTVTVNGADWNGTDEIPYGATVSMTATPNDGYVFNEWDTTLDSFDASANPLVFTMPDDDVEVEALYMDANIEYTITINDVTGGTISTDAENNKAKAGVTVTLNCDVASGYAFNAWDVKDASSNEVTVTDNKFIMPTSNVTVTATYTKKFEVLYSVAGVETTVERLDGAELNLPTPEALNGMEFAGWSDTDDIASPNFVANTTAVTEDMILYAVFVVEAGESSYQKVEADQTDWRGDYLIAYSSSIFADGRVGGTDTGGIGAAGVKVNPGTKLSDDGKTVNATWGDTYKVSLEAIDENDLSEGYVLKTIDGKYNYQSSNSNGLTATETKSTAANYPITVTFTSSSDVKLALGGNAKGAVFRYNAQGYFRFYKDGGQSAVYLYKKVTGTSLYSLGTPEKVTVSAAEYATYVPTMKVAVPDGVKAYIVSATTTTTATLEEVTVIPANEPVIIYKAEGGQVTFESTASDASDVSENALEYSATDITAAGQYVLANEGGVVGFYKATSGTIVARKAYLPAASEAHFLAFSFDDETTGIHAVESGKLTVDGYYNLNGQRVAQPSKGLYIVNGKKVVVK